MADSDFQSDLIRQLNLSGNVQATMASDMTRLLRAWPKYTNDTGGALTAPNTLELYRIKPQMAILPGSAVWADALATASITIGWSAYTGLRDNDIPADPDGLLTTTALDAALTGTPFDTLNGRPLVIEGPAIITATVTGADIPADWEMWVDLHLANVITGQ